MRTAVIAMVAAMAATSATAMDLPVPGLALNTDAVVEHKFDAEATTLTLAPELEFVPQDGPLTLTAGTTLSVWDNTNSFTLDDEFDVLPTINFGAAYAVPTMDNLELELGTSYDFETETRGEITATATFSF
jgi:hypothetical protein